MAAVAAGALTVFCLFFVQGLGLLVEFGSVAVEHGNFIPLALTNSTPTVDIQGFGNGTRRLFSFIIADQAAVPFPNHTYAFVNYWIANIPGGSSGKLRGNILEPYISPAAAPGIPPPYDFRNHTYDCVLVPQRNPLVRPMDSRIVISLPDIIQRYHCGAPVQRVYFTTSRHH